MNVQRRGCTPGCLVLFVAVGLVLLGRWIIAQNIPPKVFVPVTDLPAYVVVRSEDVREVSESPLPDGAVTKVERVVGWATLVPLKRGTPLTDRVLVRLPADGQNWHLVTAPATPALIGSEGERITLIGVTDDSAAATRISGQAISLGIREGNVIIAVPVNEAITAATFTVGTRRLIALRQMARPFSVPH